MSAKNDIQQIIQLSAKYWGLNPADLLNKNRQRNLIDKKKMLTYFIRTNIKITLTGLAEELGGMNHASIIHRVDSMRDFIKINDPIAQEYAEYFKFMIVAADWAIDPWILKILTDRKNLFLDKLRNQKGKTINESLINNLDYAIY